MFCTEEKYINTIMYMVDFATFRRTHASSLLWFPVFNTNIFSPNSQLAHFPNLKLFHENLYSITVIYSHVRTDLLISSHDTLPKADILCVPSLVKKVVFSVDLLFPF